MRNMKLTKPLPRKFKRWATKYNDGKFAKEYQEVLAHIHYAASSGKYAWEESCVGWDRDSRVRYMLIKLNKDGFYCFETANNTIRIEWSEER